MEAKIEKMPRNVSQRSRRIKEQTEMNKTLTEMKNTLEGINSRITEAEKWINDLEDRMVEFTAAEHNGVKNEETGDLPIITDTIFVFIGF